MMRYIQLFLLVFINSVAGEFLQISSAPINMSRVIRNISSITYTACHMECEKDGECESIAVTERSGNQLPTCHLLKKDDGHNKGGHVMKTVQRIGSGPRDEKSFSLIDGPMTIKEGNHIATISQISMEYEIRFELKVDLNPMIIGMKYNVLQISKGGCTYEKGCRQPGVFIQSRSSTKCDLLFQTWRDGERKEVGFTKELHFFDNPVDLILRQRKTCNGDYHQQLYANGELLSDEKNSVPLSFSEKNVYVGFTDSAHPPPPNGQILLFTIKGATGIKRIKH